MMKNCSFSKFTAIDYLIFFFFFFFKWRQSLRGKRKKTGSFRWTCDVQPIDPNSNAPLPFQGERFGHQLRWRVEYRQSGYGTDSLLPFHCIRRRLLELATVVVVQILSFRHLLETFVVPIAVDDPLPIRRDSAEEECTLHPPYKTINTQWN